MRSPAAEVRMALAEWNTRAEQALDLRHVDRLPFVNARDSPVKRSPFDPNRKVPPKCNEIKLGLPIL
jgi:hypothetical protein